MTYIAKPSLHHPDLPKNAVGHTRRDYEGKISTLCAGGGHGSDRVFVSRSPSPCRAGRGVYFVPP
jgi:hypothetical protein